MGQWQSPQRLKLDEYYAVKVTSDHQGEYSGEVIRLGVTADEPATHLFDVPPQADLNALEEWAKRALQAYREG